MLSLVNKTQVAVFCRKETDGPVALVGDGENYKIEKRKERGEGVRSKNPPRLDFVLAGHTDNTASLPQGARSVMNNFYGVSATNPNIEENRLCA